MVHALFPIVCAYIKVLAQVTSTRRNGYKVRKSILEQLPLTRHPSRVDFLLSIFFNEPLQFLAPLAFFYNHPHASFAEILGLKIFVTPQNIIYIQAFIFRGLKFLRGLILEILLYFFVPLKYPKSNNL